VNNKQKKTLLNIYTNPGNELKPYQVRAIRKLLKDQGIEE
jgi:hypothetical protein